MVFTPLFGSPKLGTETFFTIKKFFFESLRLPLAKGSSTSNQAFLLRRKNVTALRCSEPLRYKVGGPYITITASPLFYKQLHI